MRVRQDKRGMEEVVRRKDVFIVYCDGVLVENISDAKINPRKN